MALLVLAASPASPAEGPSPAGPRAAQTIGAGARPTSSAAPAVGRRHALRDGAIRVEAVLTDVREFLDRRMYTYELAVSRGDDAVHLSTTLIGVSGDREALARLRGGVGRKGKYLFVREECGGGNAWRCNVEHVFMVRKGVLLRLGTIFAHPEARAAGAGYRADWFRDVYDKLEANSLTSHVAAPAFRIWIQEVDGRFVTNLERTWRESRAQFAERARIYRRRSGRDGKTGSDAEELRAALLHNAALARYCGREAAEREVLGAAERLLDPDTFGRLRGALASVRPGELPGSE